MPRCGSLPMLLLMLTVLWARGPSAATCESVFSNVVGTTGGALEMRDSVELFDTADHILATTDLRDYGGRDRCDGDACTASGNDAPTLVLPEHSTKADLNNDDVTLAPGDHYFDNIDLRKDNRLILTGSGQVRVHVRRDLRLRDNARINVSGEPHDLVFLVGDDVRIEDNAEVRAVIYADDLVQVRDDADFTGALVGGRVDLQDDAQLRYAPTADLVISGTCTSEDDAVELAGVLDFNIEVGALTVIDTYQKPDFTRVNFTQVFDSPPLVFTLPTTDGGNAAAHRIRNVTSEGFDIMTLEPDGEDGPHVAMSLNYLAVEPGVHDLPGGRKLIAATVDTRRVQAYRDAGGGIGWESVNFGGQFKQTPAVLGQIQTMHSEQEDRIPAKPSRPWLTTAIHGVTRSGMRLALERSESSTGSVNRDETIAYFALEPVSRLSFSDSNGRAVEMQVIRTMELLQGWGSCSRNPVNFSRAWSRAPVVLATKNTRDGDAGIGDGDGGWLRRCKTTESHTELQVDEVRDNKSGDRDRNHDVRERAGVVLFSGNFVMKARELDHFRLIHDGFGIAGLGETVTVKACRDADCSQLYTDSVTVTFEPVNATTSWTGSGVLGNQVTFTGGSKTVTLRRNSGGTFDIGLTATPTPNNALRCFAGADETCRMNFATTAFTVDLPDQVSGRLAVGKLAIPDCWSDFQSKTVAIDVAADYVQPAWQGPAVRVNGTSLPTDGSARALNLVFDETCSAPLVVDYADAGEITIDVGFVGTGPLSGLRMSGSDSLVFYPAALIASAANGAGTALDAASASAAPIHAAGGVFTLSVSAVNEQGAVTRGYQPQATDRLRFYVQRTAPGSGFDGVLNVPGAGEVVSALNPPGGVGDYQPVGVQPAEFVGGVFNSSAATYSEVGLITLHLLDSDYMGHEITAAALPIGRFIPASLQGAGSIVNRVATGGCVGDSFTYMGEQLRLSVQLMALNAAGGVTRNYQGSYAHLSGAGLVRFSGSPGNTLGAVSDGVDLSARLVLGDVTLSSPWVAGAAILDIDLALRAAARPDGPYDETRLALTLSDADGVPLQVVDTDIDGDGTADHVGLGTTRLRRGRVSLGNAHGSELRDLAVPLSIQYFAGANVGFTTHALDDCTTVAAALLSDADAGDALALSDTCIIDQAGISGANACAAGTAGVQYRANAQAGEFALNLLAPGAGRTGAVRVSVDAPAWAEFDWGGAGDADPVGTATFGIYSRESGIIYQREVR